MTWDPLSGVSKEASIAWLAALGAATPVVLGLRVLVDEMMIEPGSDLAIGISLVVLVSVTVLMFAVYSRVRRSIEWAGRSADV